MHGTRRSGIERSNLKKSRKLARTATTANKSALIASPSFLFCDKRTGAARFQVQPQTDGTLQIDHAATLLAMHCLILGQRPDDYILTVSADRNLLAQIISRAQELLETGRAVVSNVPLTRREQQVLAGVLQNLGNKEIAARLSLSHRTVKFHISSLLTKFHVKGRIGLMLKATASLTPQKIAGPVSIADLPSTPPRLGAQSSSQPGKPEKAEDSREPMQLFSAFTNK